MLRFVNPKEPTVDAVGPGKIAYQVTSSPSHSVNVDGLKKVIDLVGATKDDPLRLCYLVPENVFSTWAEKAENAKDVIPSMNADDRKKVKVYVVRMTADTDVGNLVNV
jgi:hypothetical protein